MAESIKLPNMPTGRPEQQIVQMYSYMYRMAQTMNVNLKEIGNGALTDEEAALMNRITAELQEPGIQAQPAYNYAEAETLKSLIIKTAQFVKNEVDNYRLVLFGEESAEGSQGNWKRKKGLRVDVTPDGVQQTYSYAEIVQGLKTFEINAKNYIKTGYLRTENAVPIYGVAIGKDVVSFSEDGTETYHDENKVAELTADELSFYQGGNKVASYKGTEVAFYVAGKKVMSLTGTGGLTFYQNNQVVAKYETNRIGFYNNGTEYMYVSGGKIYTAGDMEIGSGHNIKLNDWTLDLWGLKKINYYSAIGSNACIAFGDTGSHSVTYNMPVISVEGSYQEAIGYTFPLHGVLSVYTMFGNDNGNYTRLDIMINEDEVAFLAMKGQHLPGPSELHAHGRIGSPANLWDLYGDYVYYNHLSQFSSRNVKHNIQPLPDRGAEIDALEPVTFVYNNDAEERQRAGLIYEDTIGIMPEICTGDGNNKAINYVELIPYLLKEIQDLRKRVKALEDKEDR